jgi:hypothetical protein
MLWTLSLKGSRVNLHSCLCTELFAATFLTLAVAGKFSIAAQPVTAIDVLLLPDQTMIDHANAANARLRENYPAGFALDAAHRPHISLLHRYVRTKDLEAVYAAVNLVFDREQPVGRELEATGYFHVIFNGLGVPGIVVRPTPELLRLQEEIVDAVKPFTVPEGTSAAFATTPAAPDVNAATIEYVKTFVPKRIGKQYNPHVTVGVGQPDFVEKMQAAPFDAFKFKVTDAAVFHLGNFGTAQKKLWEWKPPTTKSKVAP